MSNETQPNDLEDIELLWLSYDGLRPNDSVRIILESMEQKNPLVIYREGIILENVETVPYFENASTIIPKGTKVNVLMPFAHERVLVRQSQNNQGWIPLRAVVQTVGINNIN